MYSCPTRRPSNEPSRSWKNWTKSVAKQTGLPITFRLPGPPLLSGSAGSNVGFIAVIFEPWEDRTTPDLSQEAILQRLQQAMNEVDEAIAFAFIPPPIDGLGNAGGFQMEVEDVGNVGYQALQAAAESLVVEGMEQPGLQALNSTFRASSPQLFVDIDRVQVKAKDVPLSSVFSTLQAYLGSAYVNDFNSGGRTYQVRIQADAQFRAQEQDILDLDVRNRSGEAIPMGSLVSIKEDFGPSVIRRYQMYPSASVNGSPAPGTSSGQALEIMEQLADTDAARFVQLRMDRDVLSGKTGRWTRLDFPAGDPGGLSGVGRPIRKLDDAGGRHRRRSAGGTGVVVVLMLRGADNNVYTQIGIVLLVALASKNAILIVEFASEKRREGLSIQEAATEAAWLRFRAILMTAFSSILGLCRCWLPREPVPPVGRRSATRSSAA